MRQQHSEADYRLTSTSYVILGILARGAGSGYDIKSLADHSVRFFWNLSYGQIYPELKRLTVLGMVEPEDAARGSRQRTAYQVTDRGREALHDWLVGPEVGVFELRDEMLLKLFFSDSMAVGEQLEHLRFMRRREERMVETLGRIEPLARGAGSPRSRLLVLQSGIRLHQAYAEILAGLEGQFLTEQVLTEGDHDVAAPG